MRRIIFSVFCFALLFAAAACAGISRVGVVNASRLRRATGEVFTHYQQTVWNSQLGRLQMFEVVILEEEDLDSAEELNKYNAVVIPGSRDVMTERQIENIKNFVKNGGILVRDTTAVSRLDQIGKGYYIPDEFDTREYVSSGDEVDKFWREVGGISRYQRQPMLIQKIRFNHDRRFETLANGLPEEFVDAGSEWTAFGYYELNGAVSFADVKPVYDEEDEDEELPDTVSVAAINAYGEGYCMSFALNIRYLRSSGFEDRLAPEVYRDFFENMMRWFAD